MQQRVRWTSRLTSTLLLLPLVVLTGCGGVTGDNLDREPVTGTVTLDGKPLSDGSIQLLPASSHEGVAAGAMITDGKFSIERKEGLVPGDYRVVISSSEGGQATAPAGEAPGTVDPATLPKERIPAKYNINSSLTATIKPGTDNALEFPLVSK